MVSQSSLVLGIESEIHVESIHQMSFGEKDQY